MKYNNNNDNNVSKSKSKRFAKITIDMLELPPNSLKILCYFKIYNYYNIVIDNAKIICKKLNISINTYYKSLSILIEKNYIKKEHSKIFLIDKE